MTDATVFGPFSRFRIDPVFFSGSLTAFDLFDAESHSSDGIAQRVERHVYAGDAFASAAMRVPREWSEATASGSLFAPSFP